mgnify:CR=1 FL=1
MGGSGSSSGKGGGGAGGVNAAQAAEDWFEYELADVMAEYIRTGHMPTTDMYGNKLPKEQRERLRREAEFLQQKAESTNSGFNTLHRGMVMDESEVRKLSPGDTYTMRTVTATSQDRKLASVYANPENRGGEGVSVMMEIQSSGGNRGYKVTGGEVILPKGASYRITRNYMDTNGVVHISLYQSKNKKRK